MSAELAVARFVLPLRLAPLMNVYARMHWVGRAKFKKEAYIRMLVQCGGRRREPLPGRPRVVATRFSSVRPDPDNGMGTKIALDVLKDDEQGLGFIVDDSSVHIAFEAYWVLAPPRKGSLVVEVYP